jgi:hypothetical protein
VDTVGNPRASAEVAAFALQIGLQPCVVSMMMEVNAPATATSAT